MGTGARDSSSTALRRCVDRWPTAVDGLVEVTIDGDADLDRLRDAIAELGLPLYRLSTRLTSLDDVFLRARRASS